MELNSRVSHTIDDVKEHVKDKNQTEEHQLNYGNEYVKNLIQTNQAPETSVR